MVGLDPDTGRYPDRAFCADMTTEVIRLLARAFVANPLHVPLSARTALTAMRAFFRVVSVPRRRRGWSSRWTEDPWLQSTLALPRTVSRPVSRRCGRRALLAGVACRLLAVGVVGIEWSGVAGRIHSTRADRRRSGKARGSISVSA